MSIDFDLRKALQPVDPGEGFAERVMARVESAPVAPSRRWVPARFRTWPAALAASIVGATLIYAWHVDRERRGLEARRQLIQALHITGEKLDFAYQGVMRESSPPAGDGS